MRRIQNRVKQFSFKDGFNLTRTLSNFSKKFFVSKEVFSWALYDWANSVCAVTVMTAFVPVFLTDYWSLGVDPTITTARLGLANSFTSVLVAFMGPALGVVADRRGHKKLYCFIFMVLGALSAIALAFVGKGEWFLALTAFGLCMIGYNSSLVFYDSMLPAISTKENADHASSLGYSLGYLGGGVLFLLNILMCTKPEVFGLQNAVEGVKASFISVGVWWLIFSIPLFRNVSEPTFEKESISIWKSLRQNSGATIATIRKMSQNRNLFLFLLAYWLYIDGVYTVMTMSVDYGKAIHLGNSDMMTALLMVQFIGFPFAILFSFFARFWGCRIPILISIAAYGVAVFLATRMSVAWHFYALAALIGCTQGGVQALSRSLFSKMTPTQFAGEYFGIFNLVGRFAAILGPLLVALGSYLTGNPRFGLLGLLVLFVIGGGLLWRVREEH